MGNSKGLLLRGNLPGGGGGGEEVGEGTESGSFVGRVVGEGLG